MEVEEIYIDNHELFKSLDLLPEDYRKFIIQAISMNCTARSTKQIKDWIENIDEDDALDVFMVNLIKHVIDAVGGGIEEDKEGRDSYTGLDATKRAVKELRKIADNIEGTTGKYQ